jgi:hypothetical protein
MKIWPSGGVCKTSLSHGFARLDSASAQIPEWQNHGKATVLLSPPKCQIFGFRISDLAQRPGWTELDATWVPSRAQGFDLAPFADVP